MRKQFFAVLSALLLGTVGHIVAFDKTTYYNDADGKKGSALKTALCGIIYSHTALSYNALWDAFEATDKRADGKVWDMYSSSTNFTFGTDQAGSYSGEGDVYNREHSFPKSWFDDDTPMYTDLYHLYPTDGYVNGRRSNYCFGEVGNATYTSNGGFSKLGSPTSELTGNGCSESLVFEPNDIYKGDFARTYFYMVTAYENQLTGWSGSGMLSKNKFPAFTNWAKLLLLKWAKADQVSDKETNRIEAVYSKQKNRNPFIDFPGLEQYIWGTWADSTFSVTNYRNPYTYQGDNGGTTEPVVGPTEPTDTTVTPTPSDTTTVEADGNYVMVTSDLADWTGQYVFAYEPEEGTAYLLNGALTSIDNGGNYITVSVSNNTITSTDEVNAASYIVKSTSTSGYYSVRAFSTGLCIGSSTKKNGLAVTESYSDDYGNKFSIDNGYVTMAGTSGYKLQYNSGASRFRYYSGSQQAIKLYRRQSTEETGIAAPSAVVTQDTRLYDLQGRPVSASSLRPGIYIRGGKKIFIR